MEIYKNIEIVDLSLYLKKEKILVLSDFQIGHEEYLNKQGILLPRLEFNDVIKRLDKIFKKVNPEKIIINGDLKHEFGTISKQEWRNTLDLLDYLLEKAEVILVKGNHDVILGPIANKRNLEIVDYYKINDIAFLHGDKILLDALNSKILIIGHEHPAINLKEGVRKELYKCFLKGKYKNKILIVQPSFNLLTEGSDVLKEKFSSPFLDQNLNNFEVFVVADKVYYFGKIKNLA